MDTLDEQRDACREASIHDALEFTRPALAVLSAPCLGDQSDASEAAVMRSAQHARLALRAATFDWHRRVDAIYSAVDLTDRLDYGRFLIAQAAALLPVEAALDEEGAALTVPDWPQRRRAALLTGDIRALGLDPPTLRERPRFGGVEAVLGAVYMLEGSRLGGALMKRSVPSDCPATFLATGDSAAWRRLLAILDERLRTDVDIEAAAKAARDVFGLFVRSGRQFLEGGHARAT